MSRFDRFGGPPYTPYDEVDDTVCYQCAAPLPEDPQEDTPAWEGFCSEACQQGKPSPVIRPMWELLAAELEPSEPTFDSLSRRLYKRTECGAWIAAEAHDTILIGSIVEGTEACAETRHLMWPFTAEEFWAVVQAVEDDCEAIWAEEHGEESCID